VGLNKITIYTDGAARGNPGRAGWAAVVLQEQNSGEPRVLVEIGGRVENATNNQMELQAAIEALKYLKSTPSPLALPLSKGEKEGIKVEIFADSKYVVLGITEWIHNWRKNNWRGANKKRVMNRELWEELFSLAQGLDLKWDYVEGHMDNAHNNRADEIATSFADNEPVKLKQ